MTIDLKELNNNGVIYLDHDFSLDEKKYQKTEIIDLKNLHVKGEIKYNALDLLEFHLYVEGVMTLKDSVTLENLEYPFNSETDEEYDLESEFLQESIEKEQNTLDISDILWENIVLEVPISLTTTKDAKMSGEGWSLGEYKDETNEIDPRLAKLTELIKEREE